MMSSVGYSQVSDHAANPQGIPQGNPGLPMPPRGGQPLPGMAALPPPPINSQQLVNNIPGNTDTVIYKPEARGTSHIAGLAQPQGGANRPLPPQQFEDDAFPPPPPVRPGNGSADVSLNDSAS